MSGISIDPLVSRTHPGRELSRFSTSAEQKRLCLLDQLDSENGSYNVCARYRVEGPLQLDVLQQAFNVLIDRHEILRTSLHMHGGELIQIVRRELTGTIVIAPSSTDETARTLADCHASFSQSVAPLLRATLFQYTAEEHVLLMVAHPAILDQWSMAVLVEELGQIYGALVRGQECELPPPVQYAQFVSHRAHVEQRPDYDTHLTYWNEKLAHLPNFELLTDKPRSSRHTIAGDDVSLPLPGALVEVLERTSSAHGASRFAVCVAAVSVLLQRFSGEQDVVLGTLLSARQSAKFEAVLGPAQNTAVLGANIQSSHPLAQVLRAVSSELAKVRAHQCVPLEAALEQPTLRRGVRGALYKIHLSYLPELTPRTSSLDAAPLEFTRLPLSTRRARYDLEFSVEELYDTLQVRCIYRTELFERGTVERLLGSLQRILKAFTTDLNATVGDIPLVDAAERQLLLNGWNNTTEAPYPKERCVHELIEAQVERTPDAAAARFGNDSATYRELNARANQLARHLLVNGVRTGDHVGIALERSLEMLIAVLAVMKTGATYVPLDPGYPKERLAYMIKDAKLRALITQRALRNEIATAGTNVVCVDDDAYGIASQTTANLNIEVDSSRCVYMLYTSGSTGAPKGVQISHRNFVNLLCSVRDISGVTAKDVVLALTTLCFDISGAELILPLTVGAQIVIAPRELATDVRRLSEMISTEKITGMQATPALWRMLIDSGWKGAPHLTAFSCGEAVSPDLGAALVARTALAWNWYGPTETTVYSTVSRLDGSRRVTIGRPLANTQIYILDEMLRPQPVGVPGDLYIGGDGVGLGYFNRPELTAERFAANPFSADPAARWYRTGDRARYLSNGEIEFLGRSDEQLKVRGFRIEPGEIEAALRQHASIQSCVVAARADSTGDQRLIAYVVAKSGASVRSPELRTFLARKLPEYMIPNAFVMQDELPLTPSGKINRRALPAPETNHVADARAIEHPNNPIEAELVQIWEDLLGVRPIGIHDDFFALGGHSLLAVRLMSTIERIYRRRISVAAFFEAPRIESLAAALLKQSEASRETPLMRIKDGTKPPFYFLHGDILGGGLYCWNLARHLDPERPFYVIPPQGLESDPLLPNIEAIAAYHLQFIRELQPHGPYYLGGTCNGGIIALEAAQQLRAAGEDVAKLVIIDAPPDNAQHRLLYAGVRAWNWLRRRTPAQTVKSFRRWRARMLKLRHWLRRSPHETLSHSTRRLRKILAARKRYDDSDDSLILRESVRTPEGRQALLKYYGRLLEGYVPQPYDGHVELLFSREPGEAEELTPTDKLWYKIAANPRVQFITGRHATFTSRNLQMLAEWLNRALR